MTTTRSKGMVGPENWKREKRDYWRQHAIDCVEMEGCVRNHRPLAEHDTLKQLLSGCNEPPGL